jgi:hypothetical protein
VAYLAGYISHRNADEVITGKVRDATVGAAAARTCALGHLALLSERCGGLHNVKRWHKVTVFVNAENDYPDSPACANGYTDLIAEVFGPEVGMHARSAVSVAQLALSALSWSLFMSFSFKIKAESKLFSSLGICLTHALTCHAHYPTDGPHPKVR